ncbi:MAG: hypothetical protein IKS03_02500 [Ruminococcus sp.]|nr:hypothetical protein [Ruminococcus sp.]
MKRNIIVLMLVLAALSSCADKKESSSSSELSAKIVATETTETSTETTTENTTTTSTVSTTSSTTSTTSTTTTTTASTTTAQPTTTTTTVITTTAEPQTTEPVTTTEPATESPLDPSLTLTDNGLEWDCQGICKFTFPSAWKDRIYVQGMSVYSKKCWEDEEGTGMLFTVNVYSAYDLADGSPSFTYLLGMAGEKYVFPVTASDVNYNIQNPELQNEYTNLSNDLQNIFPNAVCTSSPDFRPLKIDEYTQSNYIEYPHLDGTWQSYDDTGLQFTPLVIFDSTNRLFGFKRNLNGIETGAFWENKNIDSYSNSTYWGDCGLIFLNGGLYRVTYYPSAPVTMNFETLYGDNTISAYTYFYWSDDKIFG